jgi:membrane AbrB-like protein
MPILAAAAVGLGSLPVALNMGRAAALQYAQPVKWSAAGKSIKQLSLTVGLGAMGGAIFAFLNFPLPWLCGAMVVTAIVSLCGVRLGISTPVRDTIQPIIATMIGSTFTPLVMEDLVDSAIATPFMLANTILIAGCVLVYLHRSRQFDHGTVYLSSVPGGMSQLVQLMHHSKSPQIVCVFQTVRLLLIVGAIPVLLLLNGFHADRAFFQHSIVEMSVADVVLMLGAILLGARIGAALRFPTPILTGPLLFAGTLHLLGISKALPPAELLVPAQVILGAWIGCRFSGIKVNSLLVSARMAIVSTLVIVIASFASAVLLSVCSGFSLATALLIITPGGLGETSLIAMVFNTNPKLVAIQHTIRILFLYFSVPFLLERWWLPMMTRTEPVSETSPRLEACDRMDRAA